MELKLLASKARDQVASVVGVSGSGSGCQKAAAEKVAHTCDTLRRATKQQRPSASVDTLSGCIPPKCPVNPRRSTDLGPKRRSSSVSFSVVSPITREPAGANRFKTGSLVHGNRSVVPGSRPVGSKRSGRSGPLRTCACVDERGTLPSRGGRRWALQPARLTAACTAVIGSTPQRGSHAGAVHRGSGGSGCARGL